MGGVEEALTTTKQNCGNILVGVGPVAIEWVRHRSGMANNKDFIIRTQIDIKRLGKLL